MRVDDRLSSKSVCFFCFRGHFLMTTLAFLFFTPHHRRSLHFCSLIFPCQESDRDVRARIFGPSAAEQIILFCYGKVDHESRVIFLVMYINS